MVEEERSPKRQKTQEPDSVTVTMTNDPVVTVATSNDPVVTVAATNETQKQDEEMEESAVILHF